MNMSEINSLFSSKKEYTCDKTINNENTFSLRPSTIDSSLFSLQMSMNTSSVPIQQNTVYEEQYRYSIPKNGDPLPFYGSKLRQDMSGTNVENEIKKSVVGFCDKWTGTGRDLSYRPKIEMESLFHPNENKTCETLGTSGKSSVHTNFMEVDRQRFSLNLKYSDDLAIEPQHVGPGMNVGSDIVASEGFHQQYRHEFESIARNYDSGNPLYQLPGPGQFNLSLTRSSYDYKPIDSKITKTPQFDNEIVQRNQKITGPYHPPQKGEQMDLIKPFQHEKTRKENTNFSTRLFKNKIETFGDDILPPVPQSTVTNDTRGIEIQQVQKTGVKGVGYPESSTPEFQYTKTGNIANILDIKTSAHLKGTMEIGEIRESNKNQLQNVQNTVIKKTGGDVSVFNEVVFKPTKSDEYTLRSGDLKPFRTCFPDEYISTESTRYTKNKGTEIEHQYAYQRHRTFPKLNDTTSTRLPRNMEQSLEYTGNTAARHSNDSTSIVSSNKLRSKKQEHENEYTGNPKKHEKMEMFIGGQKYMMHNTQREQESLQLNGKSNKRFTNTQIKDAIPDEKLDSKKHIFTTQEHVYVEKEKNPFFRETYDIRTTRSKDVTPSFHYNPAFIPTLENQKQGDIQNRKTEHQQETPHNPFKQLMFNEKMEHVQRKKESEYSRIYGFKKPKITSSEIVGQLKNTSTNL